MMVVYQKAFLKVFKWQSRLKTCLNNRRFPALGNEIFETIIYHYRKSGFLCYGKLPCFGMVFSFGLEQAGEVQNFQQNVFFSPTWGKAYLSLKYLTLLNQHFLTAFSPLEYFLASYTPQLHHPLRQCSSTENSGGPFSTLPKFTDLSSQNYLVKGS